MCPVMFLTAATTMAFILVLNVGLDNNIIILQGWLRLHLLLITKINGKEELLLLDVFSWVMSVITTWKCGFLALIEK